MISRFKSALISSLSSNSIHESNSSSSSHSSHFFDSPQNNNQNQSQKSKRKKYPSGRPHFLNLQTEDEIAVTADHLVRPIILPKSGGGSLGESGGSSDVVHCLKGGLPFGAGYAETINSGKSPRNEDQARVHSGVILPPPPDDDSDSSPPPPLIPYTLFSLFDGHAGPDAALVAAQELHLIIDGKLQEIAEHLHSSQFSVKENHSNKKNGSSSGVFWYPSSSITEESLVVGALEAAFLEMDEKIKEDLLEYNIKGGCTALVCLFLKGKLYTANAGDSRGVLVVVEGDEEKEEADPEVVPLSTDFTPESERARVRGVAALNPSLLGTDFTANEYLKRPVKKDLGRRILFRGPLMTGWSYKTATLEDLKFPVVFGHGKRSRVLATIGVTRGLGDHDLVAHSSNGLRIKPFLSAQPEVKILTLYEDNNPPEDSSPSPKTPLLPLTTSFLILATDGLWDVTSNERAAAIALRTLKRDKDEGGFVRFSSAAQDLVMHARGKWVGRGGGGERGGGQGNGGGGSAGGWKMAGGGQATIDDISVFVVPLGGVLERGVKMVENNGVKEGVEDPIVVKEDPTLLEENSSPSTTTPSVLPN